MIKRIIILVGLLALIIFALISFAGKEELWATLSQANPKYVVMAILAYIIGVTCYSSGWAIILHIQGVKLTVRDQIKLCYSSVFFNEVTPTAACGGEVARSYFTIKKFGIDPGLAISGIVVHRALFSLKNGLITLPLGIVLILTYDVPPIILFALVLVLLFNIGGWGVLFYLSWDLARAERTTKKFIRLISRIKKPSPKMQESIMHTARTYNGSLRMLMKRLDLLPFMLIVCFFTWAAYGTLSTYAFKALGAEIDMERFLLIFTMYAIIRMIPSFLPEWVSSKEAILAVFFLATEFTPAMSVGAIVLMRMGNFMSFFILGGICTLLLGVKKSELKEMAKTKPSFKRRELQR